MLRNEISGSYGSSISSFLRNIQTTLHGAFTKHLERANFYISQTFPPKKIAEGRTLPRSFYEATITLTPKQDKDITQKKNRLISLMNIDTKLFSKIQQMKSNNKWNPNERIILPDQVCFISRMQGYFNIWKLGNVIHHINKLKH